MSKLHFQATIDLKSAIPDGEAWVVQIGFRDGEGYFRPSQLQASDVIVLNTGALEPGTYTQYKINEVINVSWTGEIELSIQYLDGNNNDIANPQLDYLVGAVGIVSRPSEHLGLLPVVSPDVQDMSDAFSIYTLNHNIVKLLDAPRSDGGGGGAVLKTAQWLPVMADGRAPLPTEPLGDFVLDMGMAYLLDGSVVELSGVKPQFDAETSTWYAVIPAADMAELQGMVGAITVSYLTGS
jgi:hypothetical protein